MSCHHYLGRNSHQGLVRNYHQPHSQTISKCSKHHSHTFWQVYQVDEFVVLERATFRASDTTTNPRRALPIRIPRRFKRFSNNIVSYLVLELCQREGMVAAECLYIRTYLCTLLRISSKRTASIGDDAKLVTSSHSTGLPDRLSLCILLAVRTYIGMDLCWLLHWLTYYFFTTGPTQGRSACEYIASVLLLR